MTSVPKRACRVPHPVACFRGKGACFSCGFVHHKCVRVCISASVFKVCNPAPHFHQHTHLACTFDLNKTQVGRPGPAALWWTISNRADSAAATRPFWVEEAENEGEDFEEVRVLCCPLSLIITVGVEVQMNESMLSRLMHTLTNTLTLVN